MLATMAQGDKKEIVVQEESGLYKLFSKSNNVIIYQLRKATSLKYIYFFMDLLIEARAMELKEQLVRKEKKETREKDLLFPKAQ